MVPRSFFDARMQSCSMPFTSIRAHVTLLGGETEALLKLVFSQAWKPRTPMLCLGRECIFLVWNFHFDDLCWQRSRIDD